MTNAAPNITVSEKDFDALTSMMERLPNAQQANLKFLEEELDRAEVVADDELPDDVVRMNSIVQYEDLDTGRASIIQLSYPQNANIALQRVSVLAPVGAALIGLKVGEIIQWPLPDGRLGRLHVRQLIPESHSDAS